MLMKERSLLSTVLGTLSVTLIECFSGRGMNSVIGLKIFVGSQISDSHLVVDLVKATLLTQSFCSFHTK